MLLWTSNSRFLSARNGNPVVGSEVLHSKFIHCTQEVELSEKHTKNFEVLFKTISNQRTLRMSDLMLQNLARTRE